MSLTFVCPHCKQTLTGVSLGQYTAQTRLDSEGNLLPLGMVRTIGTGNWWAKCSNCEGEIDLEMARQFVQEEKAP